MITNLKTAAKSCHFCTQNIRVIDGKDIDTLRRFTSMQAKISTRRRTGLCAKHQRKVARAIKRARHMALLPFIPAN